MKTQTLGLLAILSLGVGLASFSSASIFQESTDFGTYGDEVAISGHVTVIHKDAQDNILSYQQYDNIITNEGLNCLTRVLFVTTNGTCVASPDTPFDKIGLLGAAASFTAVAESTASSLTEITGNSLDPVTATGGIGIDVEGTGVTTTQGNSVTSIVHTFTKTLAGGVVVGGAVLSNDAGNALLAARAFGADLTLNENDTLEIKWSIQIGS